MRARIDACCAATAAEGAEEAEEEEEEVDIVAAGTEGAGLSGAEWITDGGLSREVWP